MEFEYDPAKSASNAEKHGIDFEEAQALWEDDDLMTFPVEFGGERRFGAMARYGGSQRLGRHLHGEGREDAHHIHPQGNGQGGVGI